MIVHHPEQEVDEDGGHKLAGIVDQFAGNGCPYEASGCFPACPCLQKKGHRQTSDTVEASLILLSVAEQRAMLARRGHHCRQCR